MPPNGPNGLNELPPGVGRVYICEWCGKYVNNLEPFGSMKWCPSCNKPMLRNDCPKCGAPIPVPPQIRCLACGDWLTVMPMVEDGQGGWRHSGDALVEPDAEHRKQLEVKGGNWRDVVTGKAEGPDPALPDVPPPEGWTEEDFARLMLKARADQPTLEPVPPVHYAWCERCVIKLAFRGNVEISQVVCAVCHGPVVPFPQQDDGPTVQGVDNADPTG